MLSISDKSVVEFHQIPVAMQRRPLSAHQAKEDTDELHDIRVGHAIEAAEQGVEDGDTGRQDDAGLVAHLQDDVQRGACRDRGL